MWDIPGMIKALLEAYTGSLKAFVKSVGEKKAEDRYDALEAFKRFRREVLNEKKARTSDLDNGPDSRP